MGEDVGKLGGVFRITDGLQKDFGESRVIDAPLAESGIVGTAVGLAYRGYRPVLEIQFDGFVYPAYDQIVSQVAKLHFRSRAGSRCRSSSASRSAAASARSSATRRAPGKFALTAGLKVVVVLQRQRRLLDDPAGDRQRRPDRVHGAQAPLLGPGRGRHHAEPSPCTPRASCAKAPMRPSSRTADGQDLPRVGGCCRRGGHEPRGHRPPHALATRPRPVSSRYAARVVRRRAEAAQTLGLGAEISARITEKCFYSLEAPVIRVTGYDLPYPPSRSRKSTCRPRPCARSGRPFAGVLGVCDQ